MFILDSDNLGRIIWHASLNSTVTEGERYRVILGFLKMMEYKVVPLLSENEKIIACWDSGGNYKRREFLSTYKKKEYDPHIPIQKYIDQKLELIDPILQYMGIEQYLPIPEKGYESDDIIALLCSQFEKYEPVVIVSSDRDFYQLVSKSVSIVPILTKQRQRADRITLHNFRDFTGFGSPGQYLLYRILSGDQSDRIDGIPKIAKNRARELIQGFGSYKEFAMSLSGQETNKWRIHVAQHSQILERNWKLMSLTRHDKPTNKDIQHVPSDISKGKLYGYLRSKRYHDAMDCAIMIAGYMQ